MFEKKVIIIILYKCYIIIVLSKFDLKDRHKVFTLYLMEMNYECACFLTVNITLVTLRKPIKKKISWHH